MNSRINTKLAGEDNATTPSTTDQAITETLLSPRFYRTDYEFFDDMDIEPVRDEWDRMMAEFDRDENRDHFASKVDYDGEMHDLSPELKAEFIDFLVSSVTSEYSGCILYQEIKKHTKNQEIADLMAAMARDESRHAGFINRSLNHLGVAVDLGFLKRSKKYTYFRPKFIFYATYLSEKIGYARYISIYRHLERNPDKRFHPIFKWFERWCKEEFRHGEAFALMMRADPSLLKGVNKLWIRFFLLAVYATMYVRDHTRPLLYEAFDMDITEFDYQVFDITTAISKQVFPLTLDTDNPKFRARLENLRKISVKTTAAKQQGGLLAALKRVGYTTAAAYTLARLYMMPVHHNDLPDTVKMVPAW